MTLTVARSSCEVPRLIAAGDRAPLLFFMPTRRETPTSWAKLWQTHCQSKSSTLLILDKTREGSATEFFSSAVERDISQGDVILLRRPYEEDPFQSVADVSIAPSLFVMQCHDDDDWTGFPVLPSNFQEYLSFEVPCRRDSPTAEANLDGHLSRFFGAIRGDIWSRFIRHCGVNPRGTDPTVDQTLAFLLAAMGQSGRVAGYTYTYNNDNWATWADVEENNLRAMRRLGWQTADVVPAVHWCHLLDDLEALHLYGDMMSDHRVRQALSQRLFYPLMPSGLDPLSSAIWRLCPPVVRASMVRSRGTGRGWRRLEGIIRGSARLEPTHTERVLLGGYGRISLEQILTEYLPALRQWGSRELDDQFASWTNAVTALKSRS